MFNNKVIAIICIFAGTVRVNRITKNIYIDSDVGIDVFNTMATWIKDKIELMPYNVLIEHWDIHYCGNITAFMTRIQTWKI